VETEEQSYSVGRQIGGNDTDETVDRAVKLGALRRAFKSIKNSRTQLQSTYKHGTEETKTKSPKTANEEEIQKVVK
jgi:hypothetical protein